MNIWLKNESNGKKRKSETNALTHNHQTLKCWWKKATTNCWCDLIEARVKTPNANYRTTKNIYLIIFLFRPYPLPHSGFVLSLACVLNSNNHHFCTKWKKAAAAAPERVKSWKATSTKLWCGRTQLYNNMFLACSFTKHWNPRHSSSVSLSLSLSLALVDALTLSVSIYSTHIFSTCYRL